MSKHIKTSWMTLYGNKMTIFASKLAACADMNRFVNRDELATEFSMTVAGCGCEKQEERLCDGLASETREFVDQVLCDKYKDANAVQSAMKKVRDSIITKPSIAILAVREALAGQKAVDDALNDVDGKMKNVANAIVSGGIISDDHHDLHEDFKDVLEACRQRDALMASATTTITECMECMDHRDVLLLALENKEMPPSSVLEQICNTHLVDGIQTALYTEHGRVQEDVVRESIKDVKIRKTDKFVTSPQPIFTFGDIRVFIGGRFDGITEDGKIVEIKTRQKRFMGTPLYELVQVHGYMIMHGSREASIVESYNGLNKTHDVVFDDELWKDVLRNTREFVVNAVCQ
jgi:hypothetical protein